LQSITNRQGVALSPCNIAGFISNVSEEVAIQIAKNYRRRQSHCHLPRGIVVNMYKYMAKAEIEIFAG